MRNERLLDELKEDLDGSYVIERELPRGGMSRVLVATGVALGLALILRSG